MYVVIRGRNFQVRQNRQVIWYGELVRPISTDTAVAVFERMKFGAEVADYLQVATLPIVLEVLPGGV